MTPFPLPPRRRLGWWHKLSHDARVTIITSAAIAVLIAAPSLYIAYNAWKAPVAPPEPEKPVRTTTQPEVQAPVADAPKDDGGVGSAVNLPSVPFKAPEVAKPAPIAERDGLLEAIETAKKINDYRERDEEMKRLTHVAIQRKRFDVALKGASLIYYDIPRDAALRYLVCQTAFFGDLHVADAAADKIRVNGIKNSALQEIAQARSDGPGIKLKVPDDPHCGTL